MNKIDVCIPVKKYRWGMEDVMFSSLIQKDIPVNNVYVCNTKGLANARNELMNKVETKWFLFLDDDVEINEDWWNKVKVHMDNSKIGAIQGFPLSNNLFLNLLRKILLLRGTKYQRGFTSNTLIRKKAIEGIKLTSNGRLEDLELQDKIKNNGYEWKFVKAYCKHTTKPTRLWKDSWSDFNHLRKQKGLLRALLII